jgi:hypothetical protein
MVPPYLGIGTGLAPLLVVFLLTLAGDDTDEQSRSPL